MNGIDSDITTKEQVNTFSFYLSIACLVMIVASLTAEIFTANIRVGPGTYFAIGCMQFLATILLVVRATTRSLFNLLNRCLLSSTLPWFVAGLLAVTCVATFYHAVFIR